MIFKAYYDKRRFRYIHNELKKTRLTRYCGGEKMRKTGCFYGKRFNFYIDTSDGVNQDLSIREYCGRILRIIKDSRGKPFLFFKTFHSPIYSQDIERIAQEHRGRVIPFMQWNYDDHFYRYLLPHRTELLLKKYKSTKEYDVGFCANLKPYVYPKPNKQEPRASWKDYKIFGVGCADNMGYYEISTRKRLNNQLANSKLKFFFKEKIDYKDYIDSSFSCRAIISPPGISEYTTRMFDHGFLGQCVVLRKTSYDFGYSWKEYLPEVDFAAAKWEEELRRVVEDYKTWEHKSLYYFEHFFSSHAIIDYLVTALEKHQDEVL